VIAQVQGLRWNRGLEEAMRDGIHGPDGRLQAAAGEPRPSWFSLSLINQQGWRMV
jgi:hypothetical protein